MGRPPDFSSSDIVAAGERVAADLPPGSRVTGCMIWKELGQRGRPRRYQDIWEEHKGGMPSVASDDRCCVLPEGMQAVVDGINANLSRELSQFAAAALREAEKTAEGRWRDELRSIQTQRLRYEAEITESDTLLEEAGEQQQALRESVCKLQEQQAALQRELGATEGRAVEQAFRIIELSQLLADERQLRAVGVRALTGGLPGDGAIPTCGPPKLRRMRNRDAAAA